MTGAKALVQTLLNSGVRYCFANPGTSEMHLVAALDDAPALKCILGLNEGVVTGMADGYSRMSGLPGVTLLHLGPGLANGLANLHNAKKAASPIVNIVGEHATYHREFDAPLTSDIETLASTVSAWVKTARIDGTLANDTAQAIAVSRSNGGCTATLIVPADAAWSEGGEPQPAGTPVPPPRVDKAIIEEACDLLENGKRTALIIGGDILAGEGLEIAARIAKKTGARLMRPTNGRRSLGGEGRPAITRIPYSVDQAVSLLADIEQAILCGAPEPVAFFAYPGKPSLVLPKNCTVFTLSRPNDDSLSALMSLANLVSADDSEPVRNTRIDVVVPTGAITAEKLGQSLTRLLPDRAVVVDESITASFAMLPALERAVHHDLLQLTGGAIGIGLPLATGAAIGAPDRKVVCLQADGSGMYTLQSLWTQAREKLNVVTIVLANQAYATLRGEFRNVGVENPGPNALAMSDLSDPAIQWDEISRSMGVEARLARTMEEFEDAFVQALATNAPMLIEARLTGERA